jgi:hypothetical protein
MTEEAKHLQPRTALRYSSHYTFDFLSLLPAQHVAMESIYPLLSKSLGRLHHAHRLPFRSVRAIPSTSYQRRAASGDLNHTAAAMSSANETRVMDAIKHDHAELKDYYHKILDAKDADTKARWQNQFTWELARHSIGEELVVYPAMERNMGDEGKQMADKDRSEHNKVSCCC